MFVMWGDQQLLESVEAVKLFKFFGVTALFIIFVHEFVRWFDLEHDTEYSYADMILYDGPQIVLDIVGFFVLGRLYKKKIGVDHLAFLLVMLASSLYVSLANKVNWFQHSFTLYEVHCTWPWQLFVFVAVVVPLSCIVISSMSNTRYKRVWSEWSSSRLHSASCSFYYPKYHTPIFIFTIGTSDGSLACIATLIHGVACHHGMVLGTLREWNCCVWTRPPSDLWLRLLHFKRYALLIFELLHA